VQSLRDAPLKVCPACGAAIRKKFSAPAIGRSRSSLDQRAKSAGFKKLKRIGKGEYEKQY
jgi:predicted nucleic acid-binding Zn ribbon protein